MRTLESGKLLTATAGELRGESNGGYINPVTGNFENWTSPNTWIQWTVKIAAPGTYTVEVLQACEDRAGSKIELICAGTQLSGETQRTNSWDDFKAIKFGPKSEITIDAKNTGPQMIFLRAGRVLQPRIADIEGVRLTKK